MNTKLDMWKIIMIIAAVSLVAFIFLPMVTVSGYGMSESVSFFNAISGGGQMEFSISFILILAGGVATIVAGVKKERMIALIGSAAGAIGSLLEIVTSSSQFKQFEAMGVEASLGLSLWVVLICSAVNCYLSWKSEQ